MKFEVVEAAGEWIVRREGVEVGRFADQDDALQRVAEILRDGAGGEGAASLAMRYERKVA